jgi:hypothetical protein
VAELDTELRTLLVQKEFFDKNPSAGRMAMPADKTFFVAVKFTHNVSELETRIHKIWDQTPMVQGVEKAPRPTTNANIARLAITALELGFQVAPPC